MTADQFKMEPYNIRYHGERIETEWTVRFADGDVKIEFDVYDEYVQQVIMDNFDYFTDTLKKELISRLDSALDEGKVTDEEKAAAFMMILEKVVP